MATNTELIEKAAGGDEFALDSLVRTNMGLVKSIALRFRDRGVELDDLMQIGSIGLIKAIRNYDSSYNTQLSTYAVPLIMGEIKKYLRDNGVIKVSRELRRKAISLSKERERFITENNREPRLSELSEISGMPQEEVIAALEISAPLLSFSDTVGEKTLEDIIGVDNMSEVCDDIALREALEKLTKEERGIVYCRYFKDLSQLKTAEIFGISQVKVSRLEKRIFQKLRQFLS